MARISLSQATVGQTTARPVVNNNGVVLVQAGTVLTASLLDRLKGFGVVDVSVKGPAGGRGLTPGEREAAISARFAGHESDPLMVALERLMLAQAGVEVARD
ncbi:MAG: hypothetical protein ACLGHP_04215 [Vicinamibacteria bacterium]